VDHATTDIIVTERRPMVGTYSIPNTLEQTIAPNVFVLIGTDRCQQVSGLLLSVLLTPLDKFQRNSSPSSINCVMVYGRLLRLHVYRAEPRIPFTIRVNESVPGEPDSLVKSTLF
jgi:hypothetical protein